MIARVGVVLFDMEQVHDIPLRRFSEIAELEGYADYKFLLYVYLQNHQVKRDFVSRKLLEPHVNCSTTTKLIFLPPVL